MNNAGITRDQLMLRMKRDDWDQVIATNLTGAFTCVQAVLKPMIKQRSGRIVSISSVVGQMGNAGQANYAASKAGLVAMTKTVAAEVARRGVTVNAVAPGWVDTEMAAFSMANGGRERIERTIPIGRVASAQDVAAPIVFLCSAWARHITGEILNVNGGSVLCG